jgi:RsmE family RNA methyltransferase
MNLLLLEPDEVRNGVAILEGRRRRHLGEVLRAVDGDAVKVGVVGGEIGVGTILEIDRDRATLRIDLTEPPPSALPLTLVLALPRPHTLGKVLATIAAMGCKRLVLIGAARVEKSYWQSKAVSEAELQRHLFLGLEQGRDTVVPEVQTFRRFRPFVEDELPAMVGESTGLVAHPVGASPCPREVQGPVVLAVGPEGGFVDFEIACFERAGLRAVHLGERPLRVEHAVPALLGRLF